MRKILVAITLFSMLFANAEKYALIIAIGDYPKKTGWKDISSENDVPLIQQTLQHQNFKDENITILINEQATFKGITGAFDDLLNNKIKEGDIVVIHFSGHGQQIFDNQEDEEIDGKDEALVPYDAWVKYTHNYKGENHFRDDLLGNYIAQFRNVLKQDGQLLFLLDSCHSGSSTRGGKTRGSAAVFAPEGWTAPNSDSSKGSDMLERTKVVPNAAPFVLMSGASANELNYEYEGFGSLSFAFSKAMNDLGSDFSYRQLFSKIAATMNVISPKQTPTIEGDQDVKLFNNEYVKQQPYYPIKKITDSNIIKIQAGKLQRLFTETTINILPSGTTEVTEDKVITKGKITKANFNESNIMLDSSLPSDNAKDYWVFVDEPAFGDIAIKVELDKSIKDKSVKTEIATYLKENSIGEIVKSNEGADVKIIMKGPNYELISVNGLTEIDKIESSRGEEVLSQLKEKLYNYAHGQYLKNLDFKNMKYEFEFKLIPVEYDEAMEEAGALLPEEDMLNDKGIFEVEPERDYVKLQVTNKSERPLYFSIVEINTQGEIFGFMPSDTCELTDNERKLAPGQTKTFECVYYFGDPYERLILKGFASPNPINLKPTVDEKGEEVATRGNKNPLETFIGNTFEGTRGSGSKNSSGKIDGYSTEFVYEIVRKRQ